MKLVFIPAKHAALRRKDNDWLARNQDNVSEWGDMSIHELVSVSQHYKNPTKRVGLVQSGPHHHFIENKMNCELTLTYDTSALWQTGSRNLTGQKTLPTIWGTYMKLVTKYQISAINSC